MKTNNVTISFACFALFFSLCLFGEANVMTPEKIVGMNRISDPQLSPDGNKVAYVLRALDVDEHRFTTDIYVADVAGGEITRMTYQPENDSSPRWSPDGKKVASSPTGEGRCRFGSSPFRGARPAK